MGRGRHYSLVRRTVERTMRLAYAGSWPARLLNRMPGLAPVVRLEHTLPLLPRPSATPRRALRIAFASDLHFGPLTPRGLLDRARDLLTQAAPDVLLLGGDYVFLDAGPREAAELQAWVAAIPARLKLAVWGNHDLWTRHDRIEAALERAGARVLCNQSAFLPPPWDDVAVVGLDEPWTGAPDPDAAFAGTTSAGLRLALVHAPEGYPHMRGLGAKLLLCGHTHGGQVALPSGPVIVHSRFGRMWPAGLYRLPDLTMFVSRGLGNVDLPLRFFAAPDVSLFTLT